MAVPAAAPVTMPDEEPTVARLVLPLFHVPPGVGSLNRVVPATQTFIVPVMAAGSASTVSVLTAIQPDGKV